MMQVCLEAGVLGSGTRCSCPRLKHAAKKGLSALAEATLGVAIDKRCQASDWQQRPLSDAQVSYAVMDVLVLEAIATHLDWIVPAGK